MKILDVQGFLLDRKNFVPKELAIYDGVCISHYIFKPPVKFSLLSKENKWQIFWLENNFHGLKWSIGWISLAELSSILHHDTVNDSDIYVKGLEKTKFIQNYLGEIVKEYPSVNPTLSTALEKPSCFYHTISCGHCAINNVVSLYNHLKCNK